MRVLTLLPAVLLFIAPVLAQDTMPKEVMKALNKMYPGANVTDWEAEIYEVEYELDGAEHESAFTEEGEWVYTKTEITTADLPAAVHEAVSAQYAGYKIAEAEKITSPEWDLAYEVEISNGKEEMTLVFNPDGKLIKEKKEAAEDDDEEKEKQKRERKRKKNKSGQ